MRSDPVLFVDDDFTSHLLNCDVLRQCGFAVLEASNAPDARAAIEQHQLSALVTDVDLGDGADGFEVARLARAANPALAVIYVSGSAAKRHRLEGVRNSRFIAKPYAPEQIIEALDQATADPPHGAHRSG